MQPKQQRGQQPERTERGEPEDDRSIVGRRPGVDRLCDGVDQPAQRRRAKRFEDGRHGGNGDQGCGPAPKMAFHKEDDEGERRSGRPHARLRFRQMFEFVQRDLGSRLGRRRKATVSKLIHG